MERAAGKAAASQRPRVVLALLLLLAPTCVMLLDGCLRAPIVTFRGGQATTVSVPDQTIALTFSAVSGSCPVWAGC